MAKRVNKHFLIILTAVLGCGVLVLFGLKYYLSKGNTAKYIAAADSYFEQKKYKEAFDSYSKAFRNKSSKELFLKAGDCLNEITRIDLDQLGKDVRMWERALEIDPVYTPALQRVVEALIDYCALFPQSADNWVSLREKAKRLAAADPSDIRAKAYEHAAAINEWLLAGRAIPEREIETHLSALDALLRRKPDELIIVTTIADTRLRLARDRLGSNDVDGAKEQRQKALAAFEEALKTQGENPSMLLRYSTLQLATADTNEDGRIDEKESAASRETLARAAQIVPKGHKEYYTIKIAYAQSLQYQNKMDEAEDALRQLLKDDPDEIHVRLSLAQILRLRSDPARRNEAIEMLRKPLTDDTSLKGFKAITRRETEFQRLAELTLIQIDACSATEGKDRGALRGEIEDNLRRIAVFDAQNPLLFKLRGYALLLDGDPKTFIDGIQLLEKALKRNEEASKRNEASRLYDVELQFRLARAYITTPEPNDRQPGQARVHLQQLLARRPGMTPARKLLVTILVRDRQYEQAAAQIAILEKEKKDDPDLTRPRIAVMAGLGEYDKARPVVEALPDGTRNERLYKAAAAQAVKLGVLAEKLMHGLQEEEVQDKGKDKDYAGTQMLVRTLLAEKKREEAIKIVRDARDKDPNSKRLQLFQRVIDGKSSPEELVSLYYDDFKTESSGTGMLHINSAIQKADLYRERGEFEEAFKVLTATETENPEDSQLLAAIFGTALELRKLDVADRYAAKLGKQNADHVDGLYYRIKIKLARGDLSGALTDATELTRKLDSFASSWVVKGQAEQRLNRSEDAIASFSRAVERQADNVEAIQGLYECYLALAQYPNAKNCLKQGMRTTYAAHFTELDRRFEERYGDPKSVTAVREQRAKDNPESRQISLTLVENYLYVRDALAGKKDTAGAKEYLERAQAALQDMLRKWPDDRTVVERLANLLQWQGKGRESEALHILQTFAARDAWKGKPDPWLMIAQYHTKELNTRQGNDAWRTQTVQNVEDAFQKALALSSSGSAVRQQLAAFYFQSGQPDKGIAVFKALAEETKDPAIRSTLIEILVANRHVAEAEKLIREALAKNPGDAHMLALLGYIRMTPAKPGDQPNYDEALKFIEESLKIDPQNAPALYYRGMIRLGRGPGELAGSVADLTAARNFDPGNADIRNGLFDALRRRGQTDEAANELESAIQTSPLRRDLRQKLLTVYFAEKRWVQAERLIEETKRVPELAGEVIWNKIEAQMWLARGELDRAMAPIMTAKEFAGNDPEILFTYFDINLRKKDYDEVLAVTNQIIDRGLEKPWWMWMCRAIALKGKGRFGEADAAFDSAMAGVDVAHDDLAAERVAIVMVENLGADKTAEKLAARIKPYWLLCLVRVQAEAEKWDKAVAVADEIGTKLETLTPAQRIRAMSYLGRFYTAASTKGIPGAKEKAEQIYTRFLAAAESNGIPFSAQLLALNNLAYLFAEGVQPNPSKALSFSARAYDLMVKANHIDPMIADTHGWVLILNKRVDEGIEILQQVATREQSIPEVYYHLAEAYLKRSQIEEAQASIDQARVALKRAREQRGFIDSTLEDRIEAAAKKIQEAATSANPKTVEKNP